MSQFSISGASGASNFFQPCFSGYVNKKARPMAKKMVLNLIDEVYDEDPTLLLKKRRLQY